MKLLIVSLALALPSVGLADHEATFEAHGNFFQPAQYKDSQILPWEMSIAKSLGITSTATKLTLDIPFYDYKKGEFSIIEFEDASIERPSADAFEYDVTGNYNLHISFGRLTKEQYQSLQQRLPFSTDTQYDRKKEYSIIDFLPPSAQAMYGKYHLAHRRTYPASELSWFSKFMIRSDANIVSTLSNCWHATWEFIRGSATEVTVFFAEANAVNSVLNSEDYSEVVTELGPEDLLKIYTDADSVHPKIQPGDALLFYLKMNSMIMGEFETLAHTSVHIDHNLAFEKQNPGSPYPYRLAFLTDTIQGLVSEDKSRTGTPTNEELSTLRIVVRRFNKKPLPHARELLALDNAPGVFVDMNELDPAVRPPLSVQRSFTVVPEYGMGGNILGEPLYSIEDVAIKETASGGYVFR